MIGRWLIESARVLLLDEPVDIGAHIRATAAGRATIVFVAETDEALEIADRVVVLAEGRIAGEHVNRDIDMSALMAEVSGQPQGKARQRS